MLATDMPINIDRIKSILLISVEHVARTEKDIVLSELLTGKSTGIFYVRKNHHSLSPFRKKIAALLHMAQRPGH
jgi:hypothetical protein